MKKSFYITSFLTLAMVASLSSAQTSSSYNDDATGIYVGGSFGYLRVDGDDDFDDDKTAYQAFLGFDFNEYIAIEGSYIDFGDYGNDIAKAETDGYTLGVKVGLPITDNMQAYVRGGQLWYETDFTVLGVSNSDDDEGLFAGLGLGYQLNEDWRVKFDYTLYDGDLDFDSAIDDVDDVDFSTDLKHAAVGFEFRF